MSDEKRSFSGKTMEEYEVLERLVGQLFYDLRNFQTLCKCGCKYKCTNVLHCGCTYKCTNLLHFDAMRKRMFEFQERIDEWKDHCSK